MPAIHKIQYFLYILLITLFSCSDDRKNHPEEKKANLKESLIRINKYLIEKDAEAIESYVKRRNWNMTVTETGLWYMIYKKGSGKKAEKEKIATLYYKVNLLDGTLCYSSDSLNPKRFKIGQGGVESGLEEGILFLRQGDKARFIIPPHLAHGLLGDEDKIPPRSIIIYDIELLHISDY